MTGPLYIIPYITHAKRCPTSWLDVMTVTWQSTQGGPIQAPVWIRTSRWCEPSVDACHKAACTTLYNLPYKSRAWYFELLPWPERLPVLNKNLKWHLTWLPWVSNVFQSKSVSTQAHWITFSNTCFLIFTLPKKVFGGSDWMWGEKEHWIRPSPWRLWMDSGTRHWISYNQKDYTASLLASLCSKAEPRIEDMAVLIDYRLLPVIYIVF
jgi:hypothetical protein